MCCQYIGQTCLLPWRFFNFASTKSTFKTSFEHDTTWRVQNWSQKLWNFLLTYPKCKLNSLRSPMAKMTKIAENRHFWYPGFLTTCHHQNQLLRPVLSRIWSAELRNGLKSCVYACLPTQNSVFNIPWQGAPAGVARVADFAWYPGGRAGAIHDIYIYIYIYISWIASWRVVPVVSALWPNLPVVYIFSPKNPNIFLNRSSLALCHHRIGLLRPFLSTLDREEFRTGVNIFETFC